VSHEKWATSETVSVCLCVTLCLSLICKSWIRISIQFELSALGKKETLGNVKMFSPEMHPGLVPNQLIHFTSEGKLAGMMNVVINLSLFPLKKSFAVHITAGCDGCDYYQLWSHLKILTSRYKMLLLGFRQLSEIFKHTTLWRFGEKSFFSSLAQCFIGPESDNWLTLSLTHWLRHYCDLIDVTLAREDSD